MKQSNQNTCPKCAAVIPDEAPSGLCPKCALEGVATAAKTMSGGRKSTPPSIAEIAPHFPELEILELIGAGGMGAVYKSRQPQLDRFVALKILSHDLAGDPAFVERFNREARVLARLSHPNIVGIHDFGTAGPYCFLTMELVDGVNLRQAMQAGRFTPTEALAMVQHLCSALKFAHEEGILHRDIKPENILIDFKGRVKIADFGIAKLVGGDRQHDVTLTMQGSILGSPHYMAPEQIETPGDVDQRADIYSLGVVLYEMLTGELPIGRFALPSEKVSMDARIDEIVLRTLQKERQARFQTADEMKTEVKTVATSPAPPVPPGASTPIIHDGTNARFSSASAILTGISFPLAIIVPVAVRYVGSAVSVGAIPAVLSVLATLCTAVIGFILGTRALGEIRSSGGTKGGLGSALFGVTAWPILFLFAITLFSFSASGFSWRWVLILPLTALIGLISSILLVRASRRWALGITREKGSSFRPGLGLSLVMVGLLTIVAPFLISKSLIQFGHARGLNSFADSGSEFMHHHEDNIDWHRGEAELAFPVYVHSALRAEFYLVLKNGAGQPKEYSRIGTWEGSGSQSVKAGMIKIGTVGPEDADPDSGGGFAGHLNFTGESGEIRGVPDFDEWQLEVSLPQTLPYDSVGRYTTRLGQCIKVSDDQITTITGIIELEIRVTQL